MLLLCFFIGALRVLFNFVLIAIIFISLFFSCAKNVVEQKVADDLDAKEYVYDSDFNSVLDDNTIHTGLATSVSLPQGRKPLQVYVRQLTDRAAEEQIAVSRHPQNGNLELFLISPRIVSSAEGSVADYRIVAQKQLKIDSEAFAVQTQDLTGDGTTLEIFVSGQNTVTGLQQVYVFQLLIDGLEKDIIGLREIFYAESNGSYEISYDSSQINNGKNYYIVHQRLFDQLSYELELSYLVWNAKQRTFVIEQVKTIDNGGKLSENLKAIYRGSAEDFIHAIDGLWISAISALHEEPEQVGRIKQTIADVFLYFDSEQKEVMVYADTIGLKANDQVIEVYTIVNMVKSLWNRVTLNLRNKYVYNIQNYFYVTLEDDNKIKLFTTDENSSSDGNYQRVNMQTYQAYEAQNMDNVSTADFQLEGRFSERADGRQYTFLPDKLILVEPDGKTWEGAYSLFSWLGNNYLEFRLLQLNSFAEYHRSYRIELDRQIDEESDISVLLLYPVKLLRAEQINNTSENVIRLEQQHAQDYEVRGHNETSK